MQHLRRIERVLDHADQFGRRVERKRVARVRHRPKRGSRNRSREGPRHPAQGRVATLADSADNRSFNQREISMRRKVADGNTEDVQGRQRILPRDLTPFIGKPVPRRTAVTV